MLSGSALLRVFLLLVAAAVLAGAVQRYLPQDGPSEATATPNVVVKRPVAENGRAPDRIAEAPKPSPQPEPVSPAPEPADPGKQAAAEPRQVAGTPEPPPLPQTAPDSSVGTEIATAGLPAQEPSESIQPAPATTENSDPRAVELVDLNTATLAELNGLRGGGAIGRAILQRRPYASIDQLLSKRVLSRSVYQRIKDQITVR